MKKTNKISRRSFLKNSALISGAAVTVGTGSIATSFTSCGGSSSSEGASTMSALKQPGSYYIPELMDKSKDGKELKAGVIGCGGRGSGAAFDFLNAANGVTITAIGDTYKDKVDGLAKKLKDEKGIDVPETNRFVGLDAYQKVIDSGVDVVIIATPPLFRPVHFKYATEKGKHSFLEKPICVDPVGYRTIVATAKQAAAKGLCVVTGTQRHHERKYVESFKQIMNGMIGEITGGVVYWNQGMLWYNERQQGWNNAEWMIRDWVNWKWLSGDHIVEQHVHNIDVFTWFSGLKPISATGFGSRQRRITGDQYDFFSVDFEMENGVHLHSMCRQIDGCANYVNEFVQGTKGSWTSDGFKIKDLQGNVIWEYADETEGEGENKKNKYEQNNAYVLEHVNWVNHIRAGKPIDQASETAVSNMAAIMGRESAYTGNKVTWDEMTASAIDYTPADLSLGDIDMKTFTVPVPGKGK